MTRPASSLALCAALPVEAGEDAPEWVHLLPAGKLTTIDGRGPYLAPAASLAAIAEASLKPGQKLVLDECHSSDLGYKFSGSAPARGWIVALEARDDGLWGKVEWTATGRQLMAEKAYAGISPVIHHDKQKRVQRLLRASLTNTPNLEGLTALHSEDNTMDWKAMLIELLGLDSAADDAAIEGALKNKMAQPQPAMQSVLEHPSFVALQSEVAELTTKLNAAHEGQARKDAEAFVDAAIAEGRAGVKPMRDEYIALHMSDADRAKKLIEAMPKLSGTVLDGGDPPAAKDGELTAEDRQVMALFNISEEDYRASLSGAGQKKEAL